MPANPAIPMNSVQVWIPRIGLMLIGLLLMGNRPACDNRQPNLTCDTDTLVTALPGSCVQIDNPCDPTGAWSRVDGLRLCDEPAGLFIQTRRRRSGVTRELCAGPSVGGLVDEPVSFVFVRPGNLGEGQFLVTTGAALSVSAFATPGTIDPGQSSQLDAVVSGGTAPYTYDWSPATGLSATNIQDPMASPNFTVSYTVEVTDDDGIPTSANVTVNVNTGLTVTANPPLIDPGSSSQLSADFSGALPPVTYNWIPVDSLNDSTLQSPLASPTINTTYLVTALDFLGTSLSGQVTVTVNLTVAASALPDTIDEGNSAALLSTVQGGEPPYNFTWTPNSDLNADDVANPVATPAATTTYTVDVTDSSASTPQTTSDTVTVTVNSVVGGDLTACFTQGGTPTGVVLNANCSDPGANPPIVQYCWWSNWNEIFRGTPIDTPAGASFCSTTVNTFNLSGESPTSIVVRLRLEDSAGALAEDIQTVAF